MKYFILISYLLIASVAHGQQIINGNFEDYDTADPSCIQSITTSNIDGTGVQFQNGCLNGVWKVSHGTPEIRSSFDASNARSDTYALLWSGTRGLTSVKGEGIYYECNFLKGQVYKIKLQIATYPSSSDPAYYKIDEVRIGLTNGLTHNINTSNVFGGGSFDIPNVPTLNLAPELVNFYQSKSDGWYTVEKEFVPGANYSQLWIYPYDANTNNRDVLYVDDISVTSCIQSKDYVFTDHLPRFTKTVDYINTNNYTSILSGQDVTFQAGNYIYIEPGFTVAAGSKFTARIAPCSEDACNVPFVRKGFEDNMNAYDNLENLISIYPNPADDEVTVKFPFEFNKEIKVTLLDIFGKTLTESAILLDRDEFKVDLQGMRQGMYFIKIDVEGKSIVKRIVVSK